MSHRRKGLDAEREATRALRRAFGMLARVHLVKRERRRKGEPARTEPDVDAVIVLTAATRDAYEVQIKREEGLSVRAEAARFVRPGSVLMWRKNRGGWRVAAKWTATDEPEAFTVREFAAAAAGCPF